MIIPKALTVALFPLMGGVYGAKTTNVEISPDPMSRNLIDSDIPTCVEKMPGGSNLSRILFYFTIESSEDIDSRKLAELAEFIQYILHASVYWCGDNRRTRTFADRTDRFQISSLSIQSVELMSQCGCNDMDVDVELGDVCSVYKGKLDVSTVQEAADVESLFDLLRSDIKKIFDQNLLLGNAIPHLKTVRWIGKLLGDDGCPAPESGQGTIPGREKIGQSESEILEDQRSGYGGQAVMVAGACTFVVGMIAYMLLKKRRRLSVLFRPKRHVMLWDDYWTYDYVGTGDPPGSYHFGQYHYFRTGFRYLSTRCDSCRNTLQSDVFVPAPNLADVNQGGCFFTREQTARSRRASKVNLSEYYCRFRDDKSTAPRRSEAVDYSLPNPIVTNTKGPVRTTFQPYRDPSGVPEDFTDSAGSNSAIDEFSLISLSKSDDTDCSFGRTTTGANPANLMVENGDEVFLRSSSPRHIS